MNEKELNELLEELMAEKRTKQNRRMPPTAESPAPPAKEEQPPKTEEESLEETKPQAPTAETKEEDAPLSEEESLQEENVDSTAKKLQEVLDAKPKPIEQQDGKGRARDAVIGVVMLLLAIVGGWASLKWATRFTERVLHSTDDQATLSDCILPLVLMDIPDFSSPDALTDEQFLTAAIWSLITDEQLPKYPEQFEMYTVPESDVIAAGNARFGTSRQPKCETISFSGDIRFYYDAEQKSFLIPANPRLFTVVPEIKQTSKDENGNEVVETAYCEEQPAWRKEESTAVVKTVAYTVKRNGDTWQVLSAKQIS